MSSCTVSCLLVLTYNNLFNFYINIILVLGVFTGYTMLEWYNTIYPKLKANTDKPLECIQEAGEILYLVGH